MWLILLDLPEFHSHLAGASYPAALVRDVLRYYFQDNMAKCTHDVRDWLVWLYAVRVDLRPSIRHALGSQLVVYSRRGAVERNHMTAICGTLDVIGFIVKGMHPCFVNLGVLRQLCEYGLLPLLDCTDMLTWRDQEPIIKLYAHELTNVFADVIRMSAIIHKDNLSTSAPTKHASGAMRETSTLPCLCQFVMAGILKRWPKHFETNTSKEIIMLQVLATLMRSTNASQYHHAFNSVVEQASKHPRHAPDS